MPELTNTKTLKTYNKKKEVKHMEKLNRYGYRVLGKGIFVSNDTRKTHLNNNDLICGASGSSKTGSIVYPQLKSLNDSSLVVVDTKGRLCSMFTKELKKRGYEVLTLDFVNPEKSSCRYNPLDYIRKNMSGAYNELDIAKLAAALMPLRKDDRDPFWVQSARLVLEFLISFTLEACPEKEHDMYTVSRLYRSFAREMGEMGFLPWISEHPNSFARIRYEEVNALRVAEKTISSIFGFVNTALFPFDVADLKYIFSTEGNGSKSRVKKLNLKALGEKKMVLFLNVSDIDHSMDGLVNLLYTQMLQTLVTEGDKNPSGQLDVPVRIIMDDFASSAVIPDFDKILSVVRSRDIWLTMCIQSFTQLESLYTHEQAQTIVNNCDHIVYLASNDLKSAEFIGARAHKTPEAILSMDRTKEYFIEGGKTAVMVDKVPSYAYEDTELIIVDKC